jgi:hypothetical protein
MQSDDFMAASSAAADQFIGMSVWIFYHNDHQKAQMN